MIYLIERRRTSPVVTAEGGIAEGLRIGSVARLVAAVIVLTPAARSAIADRQFRAETQFDLVEQSFVLVQSGTVEIAIERCVDRRGGENVARRMVVLQYSRRKHTQ